MVSTWPGVLKINPLQVLLNGQDEALDYFVRHDLVGGLVPPVETLWTLPKGQ